jgi:SAM-dependent methyltransferase
MDSYTSDTRDWLNERFRQTDQDGIYVAHQPIYGFRVEPFEPGLFDRYAITYRILRALAAVEFDSLVDIGGAEGYKAALIRKLFGARVRSADLSQEACNRAKQIFDVDGEPIDIHALPYADRSCDVALCSETLEHVVDLEAATRELMRIADKHVVITVPREPEEVVRQNIAEKIPHAHIHALDVDSFDFVKPLGWEVSVRRMATPLLRPIRIMVEARRRPVPDGRGRALLVRTYNALVPVFRLMFGKRATAALIRLDSWIANSTNAYFGMCFVLSRRGVPARPRPKRVSAMDMLNFSAPKHRPA